MRKIGWLYILIQKKMKAKLQDMTVCNNFKLLKKLGTGTFGQIYLAENKKNNANKYAAKLEDADSKYPQLLFEAKIYKHLHSTGIIIGVPKVYAVTTEGQYNIMLMDLLGSSVESIFATSGQIMSLKSAIMIGYQMIERIRSLHERHIIHRDIKPDNFIFGLGKNSQLLYIVDFGLSKKYIRENKHIPYKQGKQLTGTARYASINTHMGVEQSRRDDIESIGYVIMYLLRGILPWQNMAAKDTKTKYRLIMQKKKETPIQVLCKGYPDELQKFINYSRNLKFDEQPDYDYLLGLLETIMKNKNIEMDHIYDWTKKENKQSSSTQQQVTELTKESTNKTKQKRRQKIPEEHEKIVVPLSQKKQTLSNLNQNSYKYKSVKAEEKTVGSGFAPTKK